MPEKTYPYHILLAYSPLANTPKSVKVFCEGKEIFNGPIGDNKLTGKPAASRNHATESRFIECRLHVDGGEGQTFKIDLEAGPVLTFHFSEQDAGIRFDQSRTERGYD